jgi:hypothetical protein
MRPAEPTLDVILTQGSTLGSRSVEEVQITIDLSWPEVVAIASAASAEVARRRRLRARRDQRDQERLLSVGEPDVVRVDPPRFPFGAS